MKSAYPLVAQPTSAASAPKTASTTGWLLQPKAEVTPVGDPLEREADTVADRVMGAPEPGPTHRASFGQRPGEVPTSGAAGSAHNVASSRGRALDPATRTYFESRFHHDFSRVRIHDSSTATEAAQSIGATAFTSGWDVVFASGQYSPATTSGRRLLAHELTHVVQQNGGGQNIGRAQGPRIQRQAVPAEHFAELIEEIDIQLANPKLSAAERIKLLQKRQEYWKDLQDLDTQGRFIAPPVNKISPRFQTGRPAPTATPPQTSGDTKAKLKQVPTTGTPGSPRASTGAKLADEAKKGTVSRPTAAYVDTNSPPKNEDEAVIRAPEEVIGKLLNTMAVAHELDEFRSVEGRKPVGVDTADYAMIARDGTRIKADLYSLAAANPTPEDVARKTIDEKSGQAEIAVVHVRGVKNPTEYAYQLSDALIATPNHGFKRVYVFVDNKFILKRRLVVDANAFEAAQKRYENRMEAQRKTQQLKPRESPKSEPKKAPRQLSTQEVAHFVSTEAAREIKARFGEERAKSDPAGHTFETPTHTGMTTQGAVEGAAQQIYSAQINSLRSAEEQKAVDALDALQTQIKSLQADGRNVHVVVVAEVPTAFDFFGDVTGVPAPDQIVYFTKMYISGAPRTFNPNIPVKPGPRQTTMGPMSEAEARVMDSLHDTADRYDDPRWVDAKQEEYQIYGSAGGYKPPRKGFRYEVRTTVFPAWGN